jgi:uncharacterized protein
MDQSPRRRARPEPLIVGVVSDTHGLLRPELLRALAGADHILHAGDIGEEEVLARLREIAPVTAVRGNTDGGAWALRLAEIELVHLGQTTLVVIHDAQRLRFDPAAEGLRVVVSGHTHLARNELCAGVLRFNPGSAGPRRFDRPVTFGRLRLLGRQVAGEIVTLRR